jgi:hypothetical protein
MEFPQSSRVKKHGSFASVGNQITRRIFPAVPILLLSTDNHGHRFHKPTFIDFFFEKRKKEAFEIITAAPHRIYLALSFINCY